MIQLKENFDITKDVPHIHNRIELKELLQPMYIIQDYLQDKENYDRLCLKITNIVRGCYPIRACREYLIKFKFNRRDTETYKVQLRHFLIYIILWYPFIKLPDVEVLDSSFLMKSSEEIADINNYINEKIIKTLRDYHIKSTTTNKFIEKVLYGLRTIDLDYGLILGLNFSAVTFINEYNNDPEVKEIMECKLDPAMQPSDIEEILANYQAKFIANLKKKKNNPIGIMLRSGTGIKDKQLTEFCIADGLKPTLTGETITIPNSNSTLIRGFNLPSLKYIAATGARKSLVMNKTEMGNAGHLGKSVIELMNTLSVSKYISDCDTKVLVKYNVKSEKVLRRLNGKYYKLSKKDDDYLLLDAHKDKHLIGKKIYVRSAATCALGDCVCAKCVGKTAIINSDIWDRYPSFESEEITSKVEQNILSSKHLLTTISDKLKFNDNFYKFFYLYCGEIHPLVYGPDTPEDAVLPNINDYAIYVNPDDISKADEMDDYSLYNTIIYTGKFFVRNLKHDEPDIEIEISDKEIYITERMLELIKEGKGLVPFKYLSSDDHLFEVVIFNNELTRPLYDIMHMINRINKDDKGAPIKYTLNEFHNKLLGLIIESNIPVNAIACEVIINRLVRSVKHPYERPDFTKLPLEPYEITRISHGLEHNKSPLVGLSFQHVKSQILSEEFYYSRNSESYVDNFYKVNVPTDNLRNYIKMTREERRKRHSEKDVI